MAPIKIGIIGLSASGSWASQSHLGYLQKTDKYSISALQNSSEDAAKRAAEKFDLPANVACYGDVNQLAKDSNVDVVAVAVKVAQHYGLVKPILEAGKDVFVEWPLGRNLHEAEELTSMAKSKGVRTMVGLQARRVPSILKARDMVLNGDLGEILGTTMQGWGAIFGPSHTPDQEYLCDIEQGANMVTIPAGHAIDALCYVLGELRDLKATLANNRPKIVIIDDSGETLRTVDKTAHDYLAMNGRLQGGGVANIVYQGGMSPTDKNLLWEIYGTKGNLVLHGSSGHVQMFHPTLTFVSAESGDVQSVVKAAESIDLTYNVGKAWDAYHARDSDIVTFEDALIRHRMIEAIYKSDAEGSTENYI